jgi:hypothetical protein
MWGSILVKLLKYALWAQMGCEQRFGHDAPCSHAFEQITNNSVETDKNNRSVSPSLFEDGGETLHVTVL